jgi:pimeloyl-ACP methyl ester carboxylesterase
MGGLTARIFAHEYASEVAGVVLIESMSPGQFAPVAEGAPATYAHPDFQSAIAPVLARFGLVRLLVGPLGLAPNLPEDLKGPYLARLVRPTYLKTSADETAALPASGAQASAVQSLGDVPLIVLTGRLQPERWQAWQADLVQLSPNSQHLFAEKSGHVVEMDEPQAAVDAITKMVQQVRGQ